MKRTLMALAVPPLAIAGLSLGASTSQADAMFLPTGVVRVDKPIVVPAFGLARGSGSGQTVIAPAAGYTGPLMTAGPGATIEDLTLDGQSQATIGLQLTDASQVTVESVEVKGTTQVGIVGTASVGVGEQEFTDVTIKDCAGLGFSNAGANGGADYTNVKVQNCGAGMVISHDNAAIVAVQTVNNTRGDGLVLRNASGATIINVRSAGNSGTGIRITNSTIAAGSAWLSSANGTNDVWFEGNSRAASLTGVVVGWTPCGLGAFQGGRENPWRVDATASAPVTGLRVNKKTNDYCVVPKTGN